MRKNLRQALQLFGVNTHVDRRTLIDLIGVDELETLIKLGLLAPTTRRGQASCLSCEDGHLLPIHKDENKEPFIACSRSSDRQYLQPDDSLAYSFNVRRFIATFLEAQGVEASKMNIRDIDGTLWEIGSMEIAGTPQHLFFACGLDQVQDETLGEMVKRNNPVLLYLTNPSKAANTMSIQDIPVLSVIDELHDDGMTIDSSAEWTHFHKDRFVDGEDSVALDKHIVLMTGYKELLFNNIGSGQFEGKLSLYEPTVFLLEYLHNARTKDDPTVSLAVLADKFASGNKQTVSGYKKQINDAAEKYGTKTVIGKDGRDRYRLNPHLDCCA